MRTWGARLASVFFLFVLPLGVAHATDADFQRLFEWVQKMGRPSVLGRRVALGLGFGSGSEVQVVRKAYLHEDTKVTSAINLVPSEGKSKIIVLFNSSSKMVVHWLVSPDGEIIKTLEILPESIGLVPNDRYRKLFQETKTYLLDQM